MMADSPADAFLIDAVRSGDADAWNGLISSHQGRLLAFARRRIADPATAEDLVQETFIGLLRSIERYDEQRSLETYLFAILRNKLKDHFRRGPRGVHQSFDDAAVGHEALQVAAGDTPSGYIARRESSEAQRDALTRALRQWAEQCCEQGRFQELMVAEMLIVLGMRNKEVAADLGLSETAVAGLKFRVLEKWRQASGVDDDSAGGELATETTVGEIWRDEGVSCLKRTTLGRYLLGALPPEWVEWVEFHVFGAACDRCNANLEDLKREEDAAQTAWREQMQQRCFASSVGLLSRRPE